MEDVVVMVEVKFKSEGIRVYGHKKTWSNMVVVIPHCTCDNKLVINVLPSISLNKQSIKTNYVLYESH